MTPSNNAAGATPCGQAADRLRKMSETVGIDHAAELRGAIAQTRLVFEGHRDAQDALEYLEQVLKAGQLHVSSQPQASMDADAGPATCAKGSRPYGLAGLAEEVLGLSNRTQQPADLVVQLLVLAELRGMRSEQASDRHAADACGCPILAEPSTSHLVSVVGSKLLFELAPRPRNHMPLPASQEQSDQHSELVHRS